MIVKPARGPEASIRRHIIAGGTLVANSFTNVGGQAHLVQNPGRVDPTNHAFDFSRKPLAAEFTFNGRPVILVANHWNAKLTDYPEHGRYQPPQKTAGKHAAKADRNASSTAPATTANPAVVSSTSVQTSSAN